MANETIKLIIEAKDLASEAVKKLKAAMETIPDAADKVNKSSFSLKSSLESLKKHWLEVSAAAVAAGLVIKKAFDFAELGANALQAEESFRQVTAAYGETSSQLLAKMKEVSAGIIDDSALMQRAVKGLQQGLSGDQIVKILEISRTAARVAGTDIQSAFDGITNAIANQQLRALKQYGINIDLSRTFEDYANKIGISKDALTELDQTHAIYNAVVAEGTRQAQAFGDIQENASEKIQKFNAQINETKETVGKTLIGALKVGYGAFQLLSSALLTSFSVLQKFNSAYMSLMGNKDLSRQFAESANTAWEAAKDLATKGLDNWTKWEEGAKQASNATKGLAKDQRDASNENAHALDQQKKANEALAKSYVDTGRSIGDSIKASEDKIRSLTKSIEESDKKIKQIGSDINKDISAIQNKGKDTSKVNPFELWQQAMLKFSDASSSSLAGDLDTAESYLQDARTIANQLGQIPGEEATATQLLLEVKERLIAVEEQRKQTSQAALQQEVTNIQQLTEKAEELKTKLENLKLKVDSSELDAVIQKYQGLDNSEIKVRVIQEQVSGSESMAVGGLFPGYGGGDRIPVLAEAGEFVHRKEAVKYYGSSFMHALNRMAVPKRIIDVLHAMHDRLPAMPEFAIPLKMQAGGEVPNLGHYSIDLNLGSQKVSVRADELNTQKLLKVLRREMKTG